VTAGTNDSIALRGAGLVSILQPTKGFRFTLDSLLLADFCRIRPRDRVLEPGAGTGIISIALAKKFPSARFVADEVEPQAYGLLRLNIERNGLVDAITTVKRDLRHLSRSIPPETFDTIVANPPYVKFGTGRISPSPERRGARQEQTATLTAWLNLQGLLKNRGRYFLVFPANRAAELLSLLRKKHLEPKRLRSVHPFVDKPASLLLIESIKGAGIGLEIQPPLIVHGPGGGYSDELKEIYGMSRG
jgi:tRNA1(Val) A37 N6-methylase TrmN6